MPKAINYIRFSSRRQASGSSEARQSLMVPEWLAKHPEYTMFNRTFNDLGLSGWKGEHAKNGFGKLLAAVKAGEITDGDCVLVEAIDRTGRMDTVDMMALLTPILTAGVSIITLDDGNVYNRESLNGSHIYMLMAKIQAANQFSEKLSSRLRSAYVEKVKKAQAGLPFRRNTPIWLTSDGQLIAHLAPHIKNVFIDYVAGLGERRIAVRLHETGLPEFEGVSGASVKKWLRNRTAMGDWGDIRDVYPPVVDRELFHRVELKIKTNKEAHGRAAAPTKYLLSGLAKCGHCGANMSMHKHRGQPYSMACHQREKMAHIGCDNDRTVPKVILEYVRTRTSLPFVQRAFQGQELSVSQKRIVEIGGELEAVSQKIKRLAAAIDSDEPEPEILELLAARRTERRTLEAERLLLENTDEPVSLRDTFTIEGDMLESDPLKLNALLQSVGYTIKCFKDGRLVVAGDEANPWTITRWSRSAKAYSVEHKGHTHKISSLISTESSAFVEGLLRITSYNSLVLDGVIESSAGGTGKPLTEGHD